MSTVAKKIIIGALILIVLLAVAGWIFLLQQTPQNNQGSEGPWGGVDVNVIEKYAADAGREVQEPIINTDQGDLLLFVFALGGAVGGFVAGYFWRKLLSEQKR